MRAVIGMIRGSALFLFLLLQSLYPIRANAPGDIITYVHKERSLRPGEIVLVQVRSSQNLKGVLVEIFGREFPAFAEPGGLKWMGFVGIDLETKPGRYSMEIRARGENGQTIATAGSLDVVGRSFPERKLRVDEKYVSPPAGLLARINEERQKVNAIFASTTPERLWDGPFLLPVPGKVISAFGKRSVYNGQPRSPHTGVDFRGLAGTPVKAPNSGFVVLAANLYYSGNTVILDHGLGLYSYFGHLSSYSVIEGDRVQKGSVIGSVGATGLATGPHLHWTVRLVRSRVDPLSLVALSSDSRQF